MKIKECLAEILKPVNSQFGAPMGRINSPYKLNEFYREKIYDKKVPMCKCCGAYDIGGAYWGTGRELRVKFTKNLDYFEFYRKEN